MGAELSVEVLTSLSYFAPTMCLRVLTLCASLDTTVCVPSLRCHYLVSSDYRSHFGSSPPHPQSIMVAEGKYLY